jgi:hypothetical protein
MKIDLETWMTKHIRPDIFSMLLNDALFRVLERARKVTRKFNGYLVTSLMHPGYLTYQMMSIRRLCDKGSDVISLRRALKEAKRIHPDQNERIHQILQNLDSKSDHVYEQVNHYIAHTLNPAQKAKPVTWNMQMKHLSEAHEEICRAAITLERDILERNFVNIFPVVHGDVLEDFKLWVPNETMQDLYEFWHQHVHKINDWRFPRKA